MAVSGYDGVAGIFIGRTENWSPVSSTGDILINVVDEQLEVWSIDEKKFSPISD